MTLSRLMPMLVLTNTCAMATILAKLPYNRTDRCDIAGVLAELDRQAA